VWQKEKEYNYAYIINIKKQGETNYFYEWHEIDVLDDIAKSISSFFTRAVTKLHND